jgi:hypothetical protein
VSCFVTVWSDSEIHMCAIEDRFNSSLLTIELPYCLMHLPSLTQTLKMLSPHVMSPDKYKGLTAGYQPFLNLPCGTNI